MPFPFGFLLFGLALLGTVVLSRQALFLFLVVLISVATDHDTLRRLCRSVGD